MSPECAQACSAGGDSCPDGLSCNQSLGVCTQPCDDQFDNACDSGLCDEDMRCIDPNAGEGGSGGAGGGAASGGSDSAGSGGGGGTAGDDVCAESVPATPVTPNVIVIIDQSTSMDDPFTGADSRWDAARTALLADDGLIKTLEGVVRFGVVLYSASGENNDPACPELTLAPEDSSAPGSLQVALNNYDAIEAVYGDADTVGDTPTGDAINAVLDNIDGSELVTGTDPTIFILATDGDPDRCEELNPNPTPEALDEAVGAVTRAFDEFDIRTFVIAVAEEDELAQDHVNDLANAGQGISAEPGEQVAESFRVDNTTALADTLRDIVGGERDCTIDLDGTVSASADDKCAGGMVTLDGNDVPCDASNGWQLINDRQIRLFGTPCDELLASTNPQVAASFPCGVIVPD